MAGSAPREEVPRGPISREPSSGDDVKKPDDGTAEGPKRASLPVRIRDKLGLDIGTLCMMFKGSLPPTIAIAIYQATSVANRFSTIGYLIAIMSVLSLAIMPRAKFIQTMLFNIIGICIGSAIALLAMYCSVQARAHTTPSRPPSSGGPTPGAQVSQYNSSSSAVAAIWLFFNIYLVNTLRASRPQLQFPTILYSIFTNVSSTYSPQFSTMAQAMAFTEQLLTATLTGFAIATGVSFFVFPMTSRTVLLKQGTGCIKIVQEALKYQAAYLHSLENTDIFGSPIHQDDDTEGGSTTPDEKTKKTTGSGNTPVVPEAEKLKASVRALGELHGKLSADLAFAKREMAYGNLDAEDLDQIHILLRGILLPLTGMTSVVDILQRISDKHDYILSQANTAVKEWKSTKYSEDVEKARWNEIMKTLHTPIDAMTQAMDEGLQHVLYALNLMKPPKGAEANRRKNDAANTSEDVEAKGDAVKPGDKQFAAHFEKRVERFAEQRILTMNSWSKRKIDAGRSPTGFGLVSEPPGDVDIRNWTEHDRSQRQLYLVLYLEFLLWSTGNSILDLVRFADSKVRDGTTSKKHWVVPGMKRLRKWAMNAFKPEDSSTEHTPDSSEVGSNFIAAGDSLQMQKDPEHLPPTNVWQRLGNAVRSASHILGSPESAFGFRVACATLSVGIVAYLRGTQHFFVEQRLFWAMIMISIGMTTTAGSGVFGFLGRIAGTLVAMCTSLIIWYIVDGKTAGAITMLWLFMFLELYFLIKYPRFAVIAVLSIVTQLLIVGYELQVRKVGEKVATSNGQPYYPIYLLAPYRLAVVSGGMAVAFIWTFFPYPLTARSQLRKDLGISLYLLAQFYGCVHTTIHMRLGGQSGDESDKGSPARKLQKAREKLFTKELVLLAGLRQHSAFTVWEPTFGGKFPKQQYDAIIQGVQNILNYMALISYSTRSFSSREDSRNKGPWMEAFNLLIQSLNVSSQEITSMLSLLSASVTSGNPLPPYLKPPSAFRLTARLEALDADILSIDHVAEPGYSAFAVMQVASGMISDDLEKLLANVKALVGEVDFSFKVISGSTASSTDGLMKEGGDKGKRD
ncbi:MAG: hypothetical protein FRX48_09758 [Lasallia pustulata]|uniref:ER transporter 6TM N-terminal domain-containing protein n=1 Tax=Lasallia pustulata TaxID=136370 RepID=A0A5M8PB34_9LECA|nr:MAG: hypothetical protein FRX48_09758 [Lasallia pustulata]